MFPPKQPRGFPSVFCCPQQPSARHNAARLSAEPVTSHCSRSRKPHPPPPRLLFAFTLRRSAPFVCIPLPHAPSSSPVLLSLFRRSPPYESGCFHQNNRGFPLGFLLPSTALCAAQRRAPFGRTRDKPLLTLAQTAPAASAPPLCVHAPPFGSVRLHPPSTRPIFFPRFALAVPSLPSLRVRLFPPKTH